MGIRAADHAALQRHYIVNAIRMELPNSVHNIELFRKPEEWVATARVKGVDGVVTVRIPAAYYEQRPPIEEIANRFRVFC